MYKYKYKCLLQIASLHHRTILTYNIQQLQIQIDILMENVFLLHFLLLPLSLETMNEWIVPVVPPSARWLPELDPASFLIYTRPDPILFGKSSGNW